MAKILSYITAFSLIFTVPAAARTYHPRPPRLPYTASSTDARFFIGGEILMTGASLDESLKDYLADAYRAFAVRAGTKFTGNLPVSLSFFYQRSSSETKERVFRKNGFHYVSSGKYAAFGCDGTTYLPLSNVTALALSLGSGYYEFSFADNLQYYNGKEGYFAVRYGIGLDFKTSDSASVDAFFRYTSFDYDEKNERPFVKNLSEIGIGFNLYF